MANNYQERKQARINRYRELAEKNHAAASAKHQESRDMMSVIPMGQPILIGHHSEARDRRYRERAFNKIGQAVELENKANYYEQKAIAAENNTAISSDDPEAIKLLKEKLEKLEKLQEIMKAANKIIRNKKFTDEEKVQEMVKIGLSEEGALKALKPDFCGRVGFASYSLQNNNANIKRIKDRIIKKEDYRKEADRVILTEPKEISEDVYYEMLEILPPLCYTGNGFLMSEFQTGSYTDQFFRRDGKFYMAVVDYRRKETWHK